MKKRYALLWLNLFGSLMLLASASQQPQLTIGGMTILVWPILMLIVVTWLGGLVLRSLVHQYREYRTLYNHPPSHWNQWPNDPLPSKPIVR